MFPAQLPRLQQSTPMIGTSLPPTFFVKTVNPSKIFMVDRVFVCIADSVVLIVIAGAHKKDISPTST